MAADWLFPAIHVPLCTFSSDPSGHPERSEGLTDMKSDGPVWPIIQSQAGKSYRSDQGATAPRISDGF
jgi:hypothetical protein